MMSEWAWIDGDDDDHIRALVKKKRPFYFKRDTVPPHREKGSMKLYWNVLIEEYYVAEFLTDTRITKADTELAINLCIARYGGFFVGKEQQK